MYDYSIFVSYVPLERKCADMLNLECEWKPKAARCSIHYPWCSNLQFVIRFTQSSRIDHLNTVMRNTECFSSAWYSYSSSGTKYNTRYSSTLCSYRWYDYYSTVERLHNSSTAVVPQSCCCWRTRCMIRQTRDGARNVPQRSIYSSLNQCWLARTKSPIAPNDLNLLDVTGSTPSLPHYEYRLWEATLCLSVTSAHGFARSTLPAVGCPCALTQVHSFQVSGDPMPSWPIALWGGMTYLADKILVLYPLSNMHFLANF